jgi:hypothetical protein
MMGMSGSGPLGAEAHIAWLGQPAQESAWPAVRDSGPGQCSARISLVSCFGRVANRETEGWRGRRTRLRRNELRRGLERRFEIDLHRLFDVYGLF